MTVWNSSSNVGGEFRVDGLRELVSGLRQLPDALQRNVVRGALRAGANVIAAEARLRVPVRSGQLKASIRVSVRVNNGRVMAFVKAGDRYKVYAIGKKGRKTKDPYRTQREDGTIDYHAAYYAFWVEFGTRKAPAKPFLRPAFEVKKEAAVAAMRDYIAERLPHELVALGLRP